jgi:hypothetical protein
MKEGATQLIRSNPNRLEGTIQIIEKERLRRHWRRERSRFHEEKSTLDGEEGATMGTRVWKERLLTIRTRKEYPLFCERYVPSILVGGKPQIWIEQMLQGNGDQPTFDFMKLLRAAMLLVSWQSLHLPHFTTPSSPSRMSTINPQIRSRHKPTTLPHQEHRRTPILLWLTQPPQHILCCPLPSTLGKFFEQPFYHFRHNVPG